MRPIPMVEPSVARRRPILSVRNLETHFFADDGIVRAVDGVSFDLFNGQTLGIVGESGCGKSVTARSILGIVERPGKVVGGEIMLRRSGAEEPIDLIKLDPKGDAFRAIRGAEIALVFQEPMSSFSAYHTVGNQIIEAIRLHQPLGKKAARARAVEMLHLVGVHGRSPADGRRPGIGGHRGRLHHFRAHALRHALPLSQPPSARG